MNKKAIFKLLEHIEAEMGYQKEKSNKLDYGSYEQNVATGKMYAYQDILERITGISKAR